MLARGARRSHALGRAGGAAHVLSVLLACLVKAAGLPPIISTTISPPWPGVPFRLACPHGVSQAACDLLSKRNSSAWVSNGCFEPEQDTAEVLNSFLLGCHSRSCSYVDIGCNFGVFAAQAAALGVRSGSCYEPAPFYAKAIERTRRLNGFAKEQIRVHNVAVVPGAASAAPRNFTAAYNPCLIVPQEVKWPEGKWLLAGEWSTPELSISDVLAEGTAGGSLPLTLLKIDIDSIEGALLHEVIEAIADRRVVVETILVELGEGHYAWDRLRQKSKAKRMHPRGGDVADLWRLQHELGYDLYRLNIHVGQEIYNWRGRDINFRKATLPKGLDVRYGVRSMRRLERVLPSLRRSSYEQLVTSGTSFLATRVQLAEPTTHHTHDLKHAWLDASDIVIDTAARGGGGGGRAGADNIGGAIGLAVLNHGNPAVPAASTVLS